MHLRKLAPGRDWYWLYVAALVAAFLHFRFLLGSRNLPTIGAEDYGMLALSSQLDSLAWLWVDLRQNVYRPLTYTFYFLVERALRFAGEAGVWWTVTAVMAVQILFSAYVFSRLMSHRRAAAFALTFTLLGSLPFRLSQFWMGYALMYCAFHSALSLALLASRTGQSRFLVPAWLIAVYSTTVGAAAVFVLNIRHFFRGAKRLIFYIVLALPLAAALAWKIFFYRPGVVWYEPVFHQYTDPIDLGFRLSHFARYAVALLTSLHDAPYSLPGLLLGGVAFLLLCLLVWGLMPRRNQRFLLLHCLAATLTLLFLFSLLPSFELRHLLFLLPLWIVAVALALDDLLTAYPRAGWVATGLLFLPLLGSALFASPEGWEKRYRITTSIRTVARTFVTHAYRATSSLPAEGPFCLAKLEKAEIPLSFPRNFSRKRYLQDSVHVGSLLAWSHKGISPRRVLENPCRFSVAPPAEEPLGF